MIKYQIRRGGEMVDTIGLGPIALKSVEVQVLSSAPSKWFTLVVKHMIVRF